MGVLKHEKHHALRRHLAKVRRQVTEVYPERQVLLVGVPEILRTEEEWA